MKFLVLLLVLAPSYGAEDVFGDLLGQELNYVTAGHIRQRRQTHQQAAKINYRQVSEAPNFVKNIIQSVEAHLPIVNIPPQAPPNLGHPQPGPPKQYTQAQVSQYRPHVQFVNAPRQQNLGRPQGSGSGVGSNNAPVRYHKNIPPHLQEVLRIQAQLGVPQAQYSQAPNPQRQHRAPQPVNYQSRLIH